jgi:Ca-activated chloride channel family protein
MTADSTDLTLNALFDRELSWWRGGSCRYLVMDVAARAVKLAKKRPAHHLAIAVDASSSMAAALSSVQALAKGIVNRLDHSDTISVISFAEDARTELAPTPADEVGKANAAAAIDQINIRSGSNFIDGWLAAAEHVAGAKEKRPDDFAVVIIASDGKANRGLRRPEEAARYASDLRQRGISTAAVAPGPDCDLSLLMAVDDPEGIQEQFGIAGGHSAVDALANCLKLTPEVAREAKISVVLPPRVEATLVGTIPSERDGERLVCELGNMRAGTRRLIVVKAVLPAGGIGTRADFKIHLSWIDASGTPQRIPPLVRTLVFASGRENTPQPRNQEATLAVLSQWQRKLLRDLIALNRQGRLREAEYYLAREMKFFERYAHGVQGAQRYLSGLRLALPAVHRPWRERAVASAADSSAIA